MHDLALAVESHAQELAQIESLDNGKPVGLAQYVDVRGAAAHLRYFAGWPTKIEGAVLPVAAGAGMHCYTRREPVGVCAQVIPWNFPLLMASWKLAPALAAGCTVVLKPAEQTPLSALRLGELALEVGFPPGVVNVLTGDGSTGAALVAHPDVDKIAFTGSTAVGREIGAVAGRGLKRVTLELGGKSPNIILPDADIDAAVAGAFQAIYFNSGQACNAGSRLFAPAERFDEIVTALAERAAATPLGPGLDPATQLGPLISAEQQLARALLHRLRPRRRRRAPHRRLRDARATAAATTSNRPSSPPPPTSSTSPARRSSAPSSSPRPTTRSRRSPRAPTRASTASRPASGRATSATPTASPRCCAPAWSTSTAGAPSTHRPLSAASSPPASGASTAATASTPTWRPRRFGPRCSPGRAPPARPGDAQRRRAQPAAGRLASGRWPLCGLVLLAATVEIVLDAAQRHSPLVPRSPQISGWLASLGGERLGYRVFLIAILAASVAYGVLLALVRGRTRAPAVDRGERDVSDGESSSSHVVPVADESSRERSLSRWAIGLVALLNLIVFVGPILISTDVFSYLAYARMGVVHGINPYTHGPVAIVGDPCLLLRRARLAARRHRLRAGLHVALLPARVARPGRRAVGDEALRADRLRSPRSRSPGTSRAGAATTACSRCSPSAPTRCM